MKIKSVLVAAALAVLSLTASAGQDARVRVVNNSSSTVWTIYTSPANSKFYGNVDLLAAQQPNGLSIIPVGRSAVINFDVPDAGDSCLQDIIAKTKSGETWKRRLNVCEESVWTLLD